MVKEGKSKRDEFLQAEYAAVTAYFNQTINFRFITFGFFITFIGIFLKQGIDTEDTVLKYLFIFIIIFTIWVIELRNRSLAATLQERGKQIEKVFYPRKYRDAIFNRLDQGEVDGGKAKVFGIPFINRIIYSVEESKDQSIKLKKSCRGKQWELTIRNPQIFIKKKDNKVESFYTFYLFSHSFAIDSFFTFSFIYFLVQFIIFILEKY